MLLKIMKLLRRIGSHYNGNILPCDYIFHRSGSAIIPGASLIWLVRTGASRLL